MGGVDELLAPLRAAPQRTGVLVDFDGTLSSIVDEPDAARPLAGVPELLAALADRYALVAVVSGRPVEFLQRWMPPSVLLSGLYGLEVVRDSVREDHPSAGAWREVVDDVVVVSRANGPAGMRVENKGLSLTLHYRQEPALEADVKAWAAAQAARSGLSMRPARKSVELHPPIDTDKGTAVHQLVGDLVAACFLGDDLGDLPAFDALDELAAAGAATVKVAVNSTEAPAELLSRADLVVDGPAGARDLLEQLL
ncbi:MAG: trehalose 6-phosphate phosphatase [Acidimicrobiaceae bacterium]|jgi:trehalose 6-phosphate phosphatase